MENSIYLGLSRQMVLRNNMDIVANNIANMNTSGYRAQNLMFEEYVSKDKQDFDPMSFVYDRGQYKDTAPGSLTPTGNPLDIALTGPGFIGVQEPGGAIAYSRAGSLQTDAAGTLLNSAGYPVASAGGASIVIPQGSTEIKIDARGVISNQDGQIGQIMVAEFQNLQTLKPLGDTLYQTTEAPLPAENTHVKQGMLEGSNVKPIIEMTHMVETLRSYQSIQNVLQTENDRLRGAIQKLTRQG
ncbi:MAG: flagellar basal-body rod protein FlgF [Alphaproteobacteria bacterium]|nr:flagellar basal-body rod protein FlgF [Alphaproteobacteria bacterium]